MQYLWESFNIKTFPAWTVVFVDGSFSNDLSTTDKHIKINGNNVSVSDYDNKLPIHIIYVGKIVGKTDLVINNSSPKTKIFITGKITIENPAFFNIFIKNTGKNSEINGRLIIQNKSVFEFNIDSEHAEAGTRIFMSAKVVAHGKSETSANGTVKINKTFELCESDLSFAALCSPDIKKISFSPNQRIMAKPACANHSSSIWRGSNQQIEYLRTAGLSGDEIENALREAFEISD